MTFLHRKEDSKFSEGPCMLNDTPIKPSKTKVYTTHALTLLGPLSQSFIDNDSIDFHWDKLDLARFPLALVSVGPPGPLAPFLIRPDPRNIWYFGLLMALGVSGSSSDSGLVGSFSWFNWNSKRKMLYWKCISVYVCLSVWELACTHWKKHTSFCRHWEIKPIP